MDRVNELAVLNHILKILARSQLQYAHEVADLYVQDGRDKAIEEIVTELCGIEENVDLDIVDIIEARHGDALPGNYPFDYTSRNYVRWSTILEPLVAEMEAHQKELQDLHRTFGADPDVEPILARVIEARRPYLDRLRELQKQSAAA